MEKLRTAFKLIKSRSQVEKALISLSTENNLNLSIEKQVNSLIDNLNQERLKRYSEDYEMVVSYFKKCQSWTTAIKLLFAAHQVLHKIGDGFCGIFTHEEFSNLINFPKTAEGTSEYIYEVMTSNYYTFLIYYAKCLEDIQSLARVRQSDIRDSLKKNERHYIMNLLSLSSLVKHVTIIGDCIKESLNHPKYKLFFEKIAYFIFEDTIAAYNLISEFLSTSKNLIFSVDKEIAFRMDELYSDTIHITNKLQPLLEEIEFTEENYLPSIKYFAFDPDFNHKEELFILELKKGGFSKPSQSKSFKSKSQKDEEKEQEILSPSQIKYHNECQEVMIKPKKNVDAPEIFIQKAKSRSPLKEKVPNAESEQIEANTPPIKEFKNYLQVEANSPDFSSPGSSDLLVENMKESGSDLSKQIEDDSILRSPEVSGQSGQMNRKLLSFQTKENKVV